MGKTFKVNRREFIAAAGAASVSIAAGIPLEAEGAIKRKSAESPGVPALAPLTGAISHQSGVPLGGIGAGSVEIRPDGYFHDWLMFNLGAWAPDQPGAQPGKEPNMGSGALTFFLRTKSEEGGIQLRRLGIREDQNDLYSLGWAKNVQGVRYSGQFPIADLEYVDSSLPVQVRSRFFSPLVPHDARTSGTPGFCGAITVTNRSAKQVEVSLMGCLRNPVAWGRAERKLKNEVQHSDRYGCITTRTGAEGASSQTLGSMTLAMEGGAPSWVVGDYSGYLSNGGWRRDPTYGTVLDTFLRDFRDTGALPNLTGDTCPSSEIRDIENLTKEQKNVLIARAAQFPSLAVLIDRIKHVDPSEFESGEGLSRIVAALKFRIDELAGKERTDGSWGDAALCSSVTLGPGETKEIRLNLAWHFPHHYSGNGPEMGHMYENWFADSLEVSRFLTHGHSEILGKVQAFTENLHTTSLPAELASSWSEQLSTLVKCTWWTKDNRFAVWEGLGCCGFHTMDITYQGSFSIIALYPELQKSQMRMGSDYQRADGRVAHFFTPDLLHVDNGFDRVDMNPQFVMLVCRDYLWTGDRDFLERVFPHVVRAIASTAKLDSDGDGLPDKGTRLNTYDNWDFFGTPSYISSLWLGSLLAGERMAADLGKATLAAEWRSLLQKGISSFDQKLWNGEYYSLWVDGENRDECCMSDQLSGVWFSHLAGLGETLPAERVKAALTAVLKHNFSSETGLVNATYPAGRKPKFTTYMNAQATACWTGVEYAMVSMLFDHGLGNEAVSLNHSIHDRYLRAGRVWNHVECGDHYYRAMCSWSSLLGATGFKVDAPRKSLSIQPVGFGGKGAMVAPWVASTAWGSLTVGGDRLDFHCRSGSMEVQRFRLPFKASVVKLNGRAMVLERGDSQDHEVALAAPVVLKADDRLTFSLA